MIFPNVTIKGAEVYNSVKMLVERHPIPWKSKRGYAMVMLLKKKVDGNRDINRLSTSLREEVERFKMRTDGILLYLFMPLS